MTEAQKVYAHVAKQIAKLNVDGPESRAMLARLRRAAGKNPNATPEVWSMTMTSMFPCEFDGKPTKEEWAVHQALTLYAWHKQGQVKSMNVADVSLGRALGKLAVSRAIRYETIQMRFNRILASRDVVRLAREIRMLIRMLSTEGIGFDYAKFAQDLYRYQWAEEVPSVRLRWGEDFYSLDEE